MLLAWGAGTALSDIFGNSNSRSRHKVVRGQTREIALKERKGFSIYEQ
jgi:hypothetical protein